MISNFKLNVSGSLKNIFSRGSSPNQSPERSANNIMSQIKVSRTLPSSPKEQTRPQLNFLNASQMTGKESLKTSPKLKLNLISNLWNKNSNNENNIRKSRTAKSLFSGMGPKNTLSSLNMLKYNEEEHDQVLNSDRLHYCNESLYRDEDIIPNTLTVAELDSYRMENFAGIPAEFKGSIFGRESRESRLPY